MLLHVCPWWAGYFIDNPLRRLLHRPEEILAGHAKPGMTVMDFGCGMGFFAIPMARVVGAEGRVIAADLQPRMLNVLRKRAAKLGVADRIQTHRCGRDSVGLERKIDFVLAFYSAHEVPNPGRLLGELYGALHPGGHLLLVEPIAHVGTRAFGKMVSLAEDAGFKLQARPRVALSHAALLRRD